MSSFAQTSWRRGTFSVPASIVFVIGAAILFVVASVILVLIALKMGKLNIHQAHNLPATTLLVAQLLAYGPLGLYMLRFLPSVAGMSLRDLGLRMPSARDIAIGAGGALLMLAAVQLSALAMIALTHQQPTEEAIALLRQVKTPLQKILFVATAVVVAPMIEELGFRVFLFSAIRRYAPALVAAVLSGAAFGLVHGILSPTIWVPLACGGIVLAFVYSWTRNYWASVVTHALFNSTTTIAVLVFHAKV
jgi:membrane protease YdiL (CAAX protease family)